MNSEKKRILHIIQSLKSGGCENMLLRTLPLLREKFDHHIITLKELGELAPRFVENGIPVTTIHQSNLFNIPSYQKLLSETLQFSPDIIITYLFHADMIGRLFVRQKLNVPVIPFLRTTYNHPKYLIARILEWLTKSLVNQYLANSEAVKEFYVKNIGVPPEKITVIPNGIDVEYFNSIIPSPGLKQSLSIKPDDFVIICVANLHINKGHRYLLEAFESIFQKHPESYLLLIGEGQERNNLENQIKRYQSKEKILFLGQRTDVPQLLKISDLFVLPTLFEGQSNAILEAMTSGIPIITTDIPENRILIKNSFTGLLVEPKNVSSLTSAIWSIIKDRSLAKKLSNSAHAAIYEKHSLQSIKKIWNNFFSAL